MKTPQWILKTGPRQLKPFTKGQKQKKGFVEKTLDGITSFFEENVFSEEYAKKSGLLQRIDPRIKLFTIIFLIVTLSLSTNISAVLGAYVFSVLAARASKIGIKFFIARVWFFIPFFAGVIALPSMFTPIAQGAPIITLLHLRGIEIALTREGLEGALLFVARVGASVSFVSLLVLTTRWSEILKALRVLKIPIIFVMVTEMTYRYIFLLIRTVSEMHLGRKSRTIKKEESKTGREWVAGRIAYLFRKSYDMSIKVHQAMISRGYTGEVKTLSWYSISGLDYAWGLLAAGVAVTVLIAG